MFENSPFKLAITECRDAWDECIDSAVKGRRGDKMAMALSRMKSSLTFGALG